VRGGQARGFVARMSFIISSYTCKDGRLLHEVSQCLRHVSFAGAGGLHHRPCSPFLLDLKPLDLKHSSCTWTLCVYGGGRGGGCHKDASKR